MQHAKLKTIKKILITLTLTFLTILVSGQNKTNTQKKPTSSKSEIDKLAEKYKDTPQLTLFTSHGNLEADSEIDYNAENKPQAVRVGGRSINKEAIAEFLAGIISQKIKQGYKSSDGNQEPVDANWIKETMLGWEQSVRTFKKGNMYFVVKCGCCEKEKVTYTAPNGIERTYEKIADDYWFTIETGDYSRKGGKKATKFEF